MVSIDCLPLLMILLGIGCLTFSASSAFAHAGEQHGTSRSGSPQDSPGTLTQNTATDTMDSSPKMSPSQTDLTTEITPSPPPFMAPGDWLPSGSKFVPQNGLVQTKSFKY